MFGRFSLVLLLTTVLLAGCAGLGGQPEPTPVVELEPEPLQVVADARVLPAQSAELRFLTTNIVAEILVAEGDAVAADAPLARLDGRDLQLALARAQAEVEQANARVEQVAQSATPEEIAAAEAAVSQAEALARQTRGGVTSQDVAAARAELAEARASLAQLSAGPRESDLARANAALAQAEADLQRQRDALSAAKSNAELQVQQAANALRNAQDAYSQIYWSNTEERNRRDGDLPRELIDAENAALRAVSDAEDSLAAAQLAVEAARQDEINGLAAAEARVGDALAARDQLFSTVQNDQIVAARARIARAEANLARLSGDEQAGRVDAADAAIAQAQANLEQVSAGPRAADLALARAQLRSAEVALAQAELALERTTLRAPFAGTVMDLDLVIGELPDPTGPALVLADLSSWRLETSDLTELDIALVRVGDAVTMTFEALPELTLPGVVKRIEGFGRSFQGDVIYTVEIEPRDWDDRLLWNMTATVVIEPGS